MQRRYLVCYIDPKTGRERLGTAPAGQTYHRYASIANVIKYGISKPDFPAGQYNIYLDAESNTGKPIFVQTAHKRF